jgi:hypothetical protein
MTSEDARPEEQARRNESRECLRCFLELCQTCTGLRMSKGEHTTTFVVPNFAPNLNEVMCFLHRADRAYQDDGDASNDHERERGLEHTSRASNDSVPSTNKPARAQWTSCRQLSN